MAVLALGLLGAGLAPALGIGANIGWMIGSVVGALLFPPAGPPATHEAGPRLGDLTMTSSAYGAPRSIGFGTVRIGGNMIWSTGIREQANVETQEAPGKKGGMFGGKGGEASTFTTYTYFSTFAIAFGEGEATAVTRIWMDGKLAYDITGDDPSTQKTGLRYRLYLGTETQLQDSLIVADKGVEATPAYRGTVYIVFDDMPLEDYGNRVPNVTAEITYAGATRRPETVETYNGLNGDFIFDGEAVAFDWERQQMFTTVLDASNNGALVRINMASGAQEQLIDETYLDSGNINAGGQLLDVLPTGHVFLQTGIGNTRVPIILDNVTYREVTRFGVTGTGTSNTPISSVNSRMAVSEYLGGDNVGDAVAIMVIGSKGINAASAQFFTFLGNTLTYIWDTDTFGDDDDSVLATWYHSCAGQKTTQGTFFHSIGLDTSDSLTIEMINYFVAGYAGYEEIDGVDVASGTWIASVTQLTGADFDPAWAGFTLNGAKIVWDSANQQMLIWGSATASSTDRLIAYDVINETVNWRCDTAIDDPPDKHINYSRLVDHHVGWMGDTATLTPYMVNTITGEMVDDGSGGDFVKSPKGGSGSWDSRSKSIVAIVNDLASGSQETDDGPYARYYLDRFTVAPDTVGAVVNSLCQRVGMAASELDTTDLDAISLPGFFVGSSSTARGAIEPLASLYLFDGYESDFKLKFVQRGQASSRTITQSQLAIKDTKSGDIMQEGRTQEVELPEQFSLTYSDKDNDYTQATQTAKRIQFPTAAMQSKNKIGMSMNISVSNTVAKQQVEKAMYSAWVERRTYSMKFPWEQLDLDPSDVVTVELDDGTEMEMRLNKLNVGTSFVIDTDGVSQKPSQFLSTAEATAASGVLAQSIRTSKFVQTWVVDSPLLRDSHDRTDRLTSPHYTFQSGFVDGGFRRGSTYFSSDNLTFARSTQMGDETPYGSLITALGDPPNGNPHKIDRTNTVSCVVPVGSALLQSVTEIEMINGANAAMILKSDGTMEVIQFQNVTQEADGSFTLDTLLRGRRGTDTMTDGHQAGTKILFLNLADITGSFYPVPVELDTLPTYWKGLGALQQYDQAQNITLTSNMRALMPYAPVHIKAVTNVSDIDFTWLRRNRTGGQMRNSSGTVPLTELTEEYEFEVYSDDTFTTIVSGGTGTGSQTGLTSPAATYIAADIAIDFPGGIGPYIYVRVYQISDEVGRGFSHDTRVELDAL